VCCAVHCEFAVFAVIIFVSCIVLHRMLLRVCTADRRRRFVLVVKSAEEFHEKGKQHVITVHCSFYCVQSYQVYLELFVVVKFWFFVFFLGTY